MLGFYITAGIILVLLLLSLLYIKVNIRIELVTSPGNTMLTIKASYFSKELQKRYPLRDFNTILNYLTDAWKKRREKKDKEDTQSKGNLSTGSYYPLFNFGVRYLVIERLDWSSSIGLNDAMYTAIGSGGLWALKGMLVGFLSSKSRLQDVNLQVEPDFNGEKVVSRLYCILKMRIVHIILITFYFLVLIVRGYFNGFTARKAEPSHRGTNENCYAGD